MSVLADKVAVVTGASSGIGRATALLFAREGAITNGPDATPAVLAFVENLHALKRMAKPEEIARSVLHLASRASSFTTGTALLVDGGVSMSRGAAS